MSSPFVVGIAGGTASGKSLLASSLKRVLDPGCTLLDQDRFYRSVRVGASLPNFDHPDALDADEFARVLELLRTGRDTDVPTYDFATHQRGTVERLEANRIIIVEGILVLALPRVRAQCDLTVFVEAPADIRLARRLRRDVRERGRTMDSVLDQYERTVRPMHEAYVEPSRVGVVLELDGTAPPATLTQAVLRRLPQARPSGT